MKKPKVQSSCLLYKGLFNVRQDLLEKADGNIHSYTSLILSIDATAIVAQTEDGKWVVNREYRHPTGEYVLGCPGGRLEEGEEPLIGAQRELFEETGYWSDEIFLTGCCYPLPGICNQKIYYFWAKNSVKKGPQKLDPFEYIEEPELKTDEELRKEIRSKVHVDAILCTALWFKDHFTP